MKNLEFYFDYISHNAYLAWTQLSEITSKYPVKVRPVPVLFAGLLKANDNVGPAEIPTKRDWMFKNVMRKATVLNVPLNPPAFHPFNPLLALRVSSLPMSDGERELLIDTLFKAVWVESLHVSEPEVVASVIDGVGLDGEALVAAVSAGVATEALRKQTADAVENDVFGVPSMRVDDEIFFGYDDLVFLDRYLQGSDPLDRDALPRWSRDVVTPSAVRAERES